MRRLQQVTAEVAADVVAIEQVLYHHAYALDARDYGALDEVFSPNTKLHTSGGTSGLLRAARRWLAHHRAPLAFCVVERQPGGARSVTLRRGSRRRRLPNLLNSF